ncbi:MAG TPA: glycine C-acetyltransferase [Candidatus Dormibacteraeota bacterium]|nr:glycine C-acetyltransferase [Candidatus Dormibacteraeota bacterium]
MTARESEASLRQELEELRASGLYRPLRVIESPQGTKVVIDGRKLINLSSNNYLGLNTHPRLVDAAIAATRDFGAGSGAVRTIAGTMSIHEELERRLAEFKNTEAALTLQSGYATNLGILSCVLVEGDVVISDELNHASIIDGIRLTKADRLIYKHRDLDSLEEALQKARKYRRKLVVTDGVFSMDGDIAPLDGIVERAEPEGAMVMVDDAHASGVLGENGRGSVNHFGLDGRVEIQVGTLSKAMGVLGGYAAGSGVLREYLVARARPLLFSTSHPPGVAASCIAAIDVLLDEPDRIDRLWGNTRYFKSQLGGMGFDTGVSETPITPVIAGDPDKANALSDALFTGGIFAQPIVFPMVAREQSRVRTIVTSEHSRAQLDACLEVFESAGKRLGLIA